MKKCFSIILFLVAVSTVLFLGNIEIFKGHVATINDSAEEVKVGLNLELTGPLQSYGVEQANGALMAFEQINQAGGVNGIRIVPFKVDNQSDPVRSAFLANRLMTQEGVAVALGPATSDNFLATIPAATENKIPIVSATATADNITIDKNGSTYDYVFRIIFPDSLQGNSMANFALNNLNAKRAIVIRELNDAYSEDLAQNFIRTIRANDGSLVDLMNYTSNETDFTSIINRIKGIAFDVIYLPGYDQEAGNFIKQAREMGITQPILGGDAYDSPRLLEVAGASALNNVYFTSGYSPLNENPLAQQFINDYREKYGKEPDSFSALGYDAARFVADAIRRAGSGNPQAIRDAMTTTENFEGVAGNFSIGPDHNPIKPVYVIDLENGVPVQSIIVEQTND